MSKIQFELCLNKGKLANIVTLATEADERQIIAIRQITVEVLLNSFKNEEQSNNLKISGKLAGISLGLAIRKLTHSYSAGDFQKNFNSLAVNQRNAISNLENKLHLALKKIESLDVKELFHVMKINRCYGLNETLQYILEKK